MMIDRCPRFVQSAFSGVLDRLTVPQQRHLWSMVLAMAVGSRASKLFHLAAMIKDGRHRTRLGAFLRESNWDAAQSLDDQVLANLRWMKPQAGETIELLIDDTRIAKRGRQMACVKKIWDHAHQRYVQGHVWVVAAVRFRGVVLPWQIVLWRPKRDAGQSYLKSTQIAARLIEQFQLPWRLKVRVLFDSYYLCPGVTKACEKKGFHWFSVAARNRTFIRPSGKKGKLGTIAPGWLRSKGQSVKMPRARGVRWMRIASVDGRLSKVGWTRLVVCKRPGDPWKSTVVFATNAKMNARSIVSVYEKRWDIEVMFKELRSNLGLGEYQMLDEQAIVRHLHLCALAHQLLTRHAMECMDEQARTAHQEVALPPMSIRLESLRHSVRRDQIRRLLKGPKNRRIRDKLEPYLMAA